MTDLSEAARRALRDADALDPAADPEAYRVTTTPFDATLRAEADGDATAFELTVAVPTLSAAVAAEETVADVVEEGWLETFERRVRSVGGVTRPDRDVEMRVRTADGGSSVVVTAAFVAEAPDRGVEDAVALATYVEGTFVQGVVPGYEYEGAVADLLASARRTGQED